MSELVRENKRLREILLCLSKDLESNSRQLRKQAEDALKVVPFKLDDGSLPDNALLTAVRLHKEKIDQHEKTIKSMLSFLNIWKNREAKMGNHRVAEAIQLTIESYTCRK